MRRSRTQALGDAWARQVPETFSLLVLALYVVVTGGLAVWRFCWE